MHGFFGMLASLARHLLNYYTRSSSSWKSLAIFMNVYIAPTAGLFFYFHSFRSYFTLSNWVVFSIMFMKFWQFRLNWVAVIVIFNISQSIIINLRVKFENYITWLYTPFASNMLLRDCHILSLDCMLQFFPLQFIISRISIIQCALACSAMGKCF